MRIERAALLIAAVVAGTGVATTLPASAAAAPGAPAAGARTPSGAELTEIARDYLQKRADQLTLGSQGVQSLRTPRLAGELAARARQDAAVLSERRDMYRENDGGNKSARVVLGSPKVTAAGDRVTLEATEETRLYYAQVPKGEPAYESFSLPHTFTFTFTFTFRDEGGWKLVADEAHTAPGAPSAPTQTDAARPADPAGREGGGGEAPAGTQRPAAPAARDVELMGMSTAKRKKVVSYANKYVHSYNSRYRRYEQDCTNFVSQAMRAGGWSHKGSGFWDRKDSDKWYYGGSTRTTSYTWAAAENWGVFARDKSRRTKPLSNVWYLRAADVLQANLDGSGGKDHSMIVAKKGANETYLNYHTVNTKNKKLSRLIKENPGATWYAHRV
ncbi:amidase domain-containing protein [Streptomyces sp. Da 82-17]|uniref:amidase domain-containing protein n=1 Tax=Streptomyces sp. Da 82-17 TaxID=3377116 RepID=UPI0038D43E79